MFQLTFNADADRRVRRLAQLSKEGAAAQAFWTNLASLIEQITAAPVELGEVKYDYRHVKLRSYLVLRNFIAVQYAVSEEHGFVFVEKVSLSGKHPYPAEFEEILNSKNI